MDERNKIVKMLKDQRKHTGNVIAENKKILGLKDSEVRKLKKVIENSAIVPR